MTTTTERNERIRPPLTGDERSLLTAFLDYHRATLRVTCEGLSDADSRRAVLPSALSTVIGLVTHLCWDEHFWFEVVLAGRESRAPHHATGPASEPAASPDVGLEQALAEYDRQCAISREVVADLDLDHEVYWHDRAVSVRWVLIRLIEETARHNGHLDAVRELIDDTTGHGCEEA